MPLHFVGAFKLTSSIIYSPAMWSSCSVWCDFRCGMIMLHNKSDVIGRGKSMVLGDGFGSKSHAGW